MAPTAIPRGEDATPHFFEIDFHFHLKHVFGTMERVLSEGGKQPVTAVCGGRAATDRALVVGAGIAGLGAAVLLARRGVDVEVFEAADSPGGLLAPIPFAGRQCDRGSHRVHPAADPLLMQLTHDAGWVERPRDGRLVLGGRHIRYPLQPVDFLRGLGPGAAVDMGLSYLLRRRHPAGDDRWERDRGVAGRADVGFEEFVVQRVGRAAYRRFYRPYAVKVWGEEPASLSQSVAKQRVSMSQPVTSLRKRTLAGGERFLYPRSGMSDVIRGLHRQALAAGVRFQFGRRWSPGDGANDGRPVFYSGHLGELAPGAGLSHRGLYLLHLTFPREAVGPADTWYVPEEQFWFGRVSQPALFSSGSLESDRTIVCVEIPESRWGAHADFLARSKAVVRQLLDAGILGRAVQPSEARQTFVEHVYPLYLRGWFERWQRALIDVRAMGNVIPIGRQGLFLHCNMDHSLKIAADAVTHVLAGRDAASWLARCGDYLDFSVRD